MGNQVEPLDLDKNNNEAVVNTSQPQAIVASVVAPSIVLSFFPCDCLWDTSQISLLVQSSWSFSTISMYHSSDRTLSTTSLLYLSISAMSISGATLLPRE